MKLYKAFNNEGGCLTSNYGSKRFKIGETYTLEDSVILKLCLKGYHGCPVPVDCFRYYNPNDGPVILTLIEVDESKGIVKGEDIDAHKACFRSFKILKEVPINELDGCEKDFEGNTVWFKGPHVHRVGGPAKIFANGTKMWYQDSLIHREDGPAIEWTNGNKEWFKNNNRHREDGPAIEDSFMGRRWYHDGQLHREDGPAVETIDGSRMWFYKGKNHRDEGKPAIEWANGDREWWVNGKRQRDKGSTITKA